VHFSKYFLYPELFFSQLLQAGGEREKGDPIYLLTRPAIFYYGIELEIYAYARTFVYARTMYKKNNPPTDCGSLFLINTGIQAKTVP